MNYLKLNDMITVKAFYIQESDPQKMLNDSYIELLVNEIGADTVQAIILTPLPSEVPLKRGDVLQIQEEEILYSARLKDIPRRSLDDTSVH